MKSLIVLRLPHGGGNPRNSEGAFATLADGRILFAYTHYTGDDWNDHAPAQIAARVSADGGETWTPNDTLVLANDARCNIMSVSLLRLRDGRLALFYARKNSLLDTRLHLRTSSDEGERWSEPVRCIPAPGYFVVNNDRVVQLRSGRLIVPAAYHRTRTDTVDMPETAFDFCGIALFFLSDDAGATWRESEHWLALPEKSRSGLQEPGVVELADGALYAWARTGTGHQWEMRSQDGGLNWSAPRRSVFASPCSPLSMKRIPSTGHLLAVWNDTGGGEAGSDSSWGRTPLSAAVSRNEGLTWSRSRPLETDPDHGYCYTAMHFTGDSVLLAYCCGGGNTGVLQDLCIRKVELDWFYDE
ncbi:MAG: exo-alpha-sialidase [Lentisphaerae bacterium]|nr:exo-alpha-sialidase [Lentisphaerota bacterium]